MKKILATFLVLSSQMIFANSFCSSDVQQAMQSAAKEKQTILRLSHQGIDDGCAIELSYWLKKNPVVDRLDLSSNAIGNAGVQGLMKTIRQDNTLRSLILDDNTFTKPGMLAITAMIKVNQTLKRLDLGGNHLHAEDMVGFANALVANRSLQWLYLNENNLGQRSIAELLKALEVNKTLKYIHLGHNGVNSGQKTLWKASYSKSEVEIVF